uniref:RING-type domain-containing protein n=1 Tax=Kalanchoe fedtschenkoi TaxID=63787 RepID=A0A7N0U2W2_KALFE
MASSDEFNRRRREEIDSLLHVESGRTNWELETQCKRHTKELLQALNYRANNLLSEKDDELLNARRRNVELQANIRRVQAEVYAWKSIADAGRAVAQNLQKTVQEAEARQKRNNGDDDNVALTESGVGSGETSVGSSDHSVDPRLACMVCVAREACMILMPCRHMCCCRPCAIAVKHCPICGTHNCHGLLVNME